MISLTMTEIQEEPHFLVTPLGVLFINTNGAIYTVKDGERWSEIGPIPESDREEELQWMKPEPDDEPF